MGKKNEHGNLKWSYLTKTHFYNLVSGEKLCAQPNTESL